jgi:hypothetical protein
MFGSAQEAKERRDARAAADRNRRGGNGNGGRNSVQDPRAKAYRDYVAKNPQRGTAGTQNTGGHKKGGLVDKAARERGFAGVGGRDPGGASIHSKTTVRKTRSVPPTWDNFWDILQMAGSVLTGNVPGMVKNMVEQMGKPTGTTTRRENDSTAGEKGFQAGPQPNQAVAAKPRGTDPEDSEGELSRRRASNSAGGAGYRASLLSRAGRASVSGRK